MLDVTGAALRSAIADWRDDQSLAFMRQMHDAAAAGMAALERRLDAIALSDALLAAETQARRIMRPAIRDYLLVRLDDVFVDGARALRRINPALETIALDYGSVNMRPVLPREESPRAGGTWLPTLVSSQIEVFEKALDSVVPDMVRDRARDWARRATRQVGDSSGANARLRAAGTAELTCVWLGPGADEAEAAPLLTRLLAMTDTTAANAGRVIA